MRGDGGVGMAVAKRVPGRRTRRMAGHGSALCARAFDRRRRDSPPAQVTDIQRSRLMAAAVGAIEDLGYAQTTVGQITARARVSRRTFYELFANRDECLAAVLEDIVGQVAGGARRAGLEGLAWRERVRGGLWTILSFLDREPVLARVCVVQAMRAGAGVQERREEILARLAAVVDEGRLEGARGEGCSALTAEGLVGAAFAIVYARLLKGRACAVDGPAGGADGDDRAALPGARGGAARARPARAHPARRGVPAATCRCAAWCG